MAESERRFQRFTLSKGSFTRQRIKSKGFLGLLKGWSECQVKDMSAAGMLVLSKHDVPLGETVTVELSFGTSFKLVFVGSVMNLGRDKSSNMNKIGVKLSPPEIGSEEENFVKTLSERFKPSH